MDQHERHQLAILTAGGEPESRADFDARLCAAPNKVDALSPDERALREALGVH